ncbi:MAG TPA: CGNR zinc finger domain-containing protein [Trichormus sp.]|jgi:predicted RNA-binding Zn ribbon-like protein
MDNPPAIFLSDSAGLNFLNSIATPTDTEVDWLADGEGLLNWLEQAQLVPTEALESIRKQALPGELDKIANQARNLREWFRSFVHKHQGVTLDKVALHELEPLNRLMERDDAFHQIVLQPNNHEVHPGLQLKRRWRSPETLLIPIGEALARFICEEDFANVKICEGTACTLMFADNTRGHKRRWCSMAICGNRAKQSAHRKRFREND